MEPSSGSCLWDHGGGGVQTLCVAVLRGSSSWRSTELSPARVALWHVAVRIPAPCAPARGAWWLKGLQERLVPGLGVGHRLLLSHRVAVFGLLFWRDVLFPLSLVPVTSVPDTEERTQVRLEAPLDISGATACSEQGHL